MKFRDLFKRRATPTVSRRAPLASALEPRMLFDGAVAATTADTVLTAADATHTQAADNSSQHANDAVTPPAASSDQRQEIVFVDSNVQDYQQLVSGLSESPEVVVLDSNKDGLQQIADHLSGRNGIDAIHVFGHGDTGKVQLGTLWLGNGNLESKSELLAAIGQALTVDGDILLYGCDTGSGSNGVTFIQSLAELTGADVAASNNATGAVSQGGDWQLEIHQGSIETAVLQASSYEGVLATIVTESFNSDPTGNADGALGVTVSWSGTSFDLSGMSGGDLVGMTYQQYLPGSLGLDSLANNTGSMETFKISSVGGPIAFYGLDVNNSFGGAPITVAGYLGGTLVSSQLVSVGQNSTITFNGIVVDEVRMTANHFAASIDNFSFSTELPPAISSATYNASTGVLSVVGTGMRAGDDINPKLLTLVGEGGASYTLTSSAVQASSATGFSITLNASDRSAIGQIFNQNGTHATGGVSFGLAATAGWYANPASAADMHDNPVTVSNVPPPTITNATYNASTGTLTVSGSGFTMRSGGANDVVASKLTITGQGGSTYTLSDTANVDISSGTSFTLTLSTADHAALKVLLNRNGSSSSSGAVYNLAAADDWMAGAAASLNIADASNSVTVSNASTAPTISNLSGDSVAWAGVGNTVLLDVAGNAVLAAPELDALNGGAGDWQDATLTIQRAGNAVASDTFGFYLAGALFTVDGNNLRSNGQTFATFTNSNGLLAITFTSGGTTATSALVNDVAQRITYRNDTPTGDTTIRFTLTDGGSGATTAGVSVTSDTIYVTNTTDSFTIDPSNGVSFSEAVAIAAADQTGHQTLVFTSNFNGTMALAGNLAINESLTLDTRLANGLNITGNTITLGSGTALSLINSGAVTLSSTLAGSGSLIKSGAGTLVLASTSNEASMSGAISVDQGVLQIASDDQLSSGTLNLSGGTLNSGSSTLTIDNAIWIGGLSGFGGTIHVDGAGAGMLTLSGVISGTGPLTKSGQGTLQLSGSNTYTGLTLVDEGTLNVANANALGTSASRTTVHDGASVHIADGLSVAESFTLNGSGKTVSGIEYGALHLIGGSSTISGTVTLGGSDVSISVASGANLTISGLLSGSSALTKNGAGTLTLSNTGNEASHTGRTVINVGTLSIASDDNLSAEIITLNGGTLAVTGATTIDNVIGVIGTSTINTSADVTLSGALRGSSELTKAGAGTLTLASTDNSHTGTVIVAAGGLTLSGGSAISDISAVTISNGATLTIESAETIGSLYGFGNVVLNAGLTVGGDNMSRDFRGVISGTGSFTKVGTGYMVLAGNNTYTGATHVSAGNLVLSSVGDTLSDDSAVTVDEGAGLVILSDQTVGSIAGAGTVGIGTLTLTLGSDGSSTTFSGNITGSGILAFDGSGTFTLSGANSTSSWATQVSGGGTVSIAGASNLGSGAVLLDDGTLAVTSSGTINQAMTLGASGGSVQVDSGVAVTLNGVLSGAGTLIKTGSGTLALSQPNTYTGDTYVSGGTLAVTGSVTGFVRIGGGATLAGGGVITGAVIVQSGGTLSPGGSAAGDEIGTLTINGGLQMQSGSILSVQISGASSYDKLNVVGFPSLNDAILSVTHGYTPGIGDSYTIIENDASDPTPGTFSGVAAGSTITAGGNGTLLTANYTGGTGNDFTLTAPTNTLPVVSNLDGDTVAYTAGEVVMLDADSQLSVSDAEDDLSNWNGGSLVVQRVTGGVADPSINDLFGFNPGWALTISGNEIQFAGLTFATFTNSGGVLTVNFTGSSLAATRALVEHVLRNLTYQNNTPYGDATIRVSLTDSMGGASDSDVTLTSSVIYVDSTSDDSDGDAADGFSLREALARGAAQAGADSIYVVLTDNSTITLSSGVVSGAGDTLDLDNANGLTITGSTLTLGGALTINNGSNDRATIGSTLVGSSMLSKTGAGTLALSSIGNDANFSGAIAIKGGTLSVASDDALGSGELQLDGGTFSVTATGQTIDNAISILNGSGTIEINTGIEATLSGQIRGNAELQKTGAGKLYLTNTNNSAASWSFGQVDGTTRITSSSQIGSGALKLTGGTLEINATTSETFSQDIQAISTAAINADGSITAAVITLSGAMTGSGALSINAGDSQVYISQGSGLTGDLTFSSSGSSGLVAAIGSGTLGTGQITLTNGATLGVAGTTRTLTNNITLLGDATLRTGSSPGNTITFSGVISESGGTRNLTTNADTYGTGTAIELTGLNTYTGTTTLIRGMLKVASDANLGAGNIVLNGGTLNVTGATTIDNNVVVGAGSTIQVDAATTISGGISGSGNLTKTGSDTLTLSGTQTGSGSMTVNAGTLSVAGDANLTSGNIIFNSGTLAVTGATTIDNNLVFNAGGGTLQTDAAATLSGVLTGTGTFVKTGSAELTLTGIQTLSGATTLSAGTLSVASDANLGAGAITLNGGTLKVSGATTIDNSIILATASAIQTTAATTLSGVISGSGSLTKSGSSSLTLSNTQTYTGSTTVAAGTLSIASDANLGAGTLIMDGGTLSVNGMTSIDNDLQINSASTLQANAAVTMTGTVSGGAATLSKSGSDSLTLTNSANRSSFSGGIDVLAGTLAVTHGNALSNGEIGLADGTHLRVGSANSVVSNDILVNGQVSLSTDAAVSSNGVTFSGDITESTPGQQITINADATNNVIFSNNTTDVLTTSLASGTLILAGAEFDQSLVTGAGTRLEGSGGISNLRVSGTLAPGSLANAGRIDVYNDLTFLSGSSLEVDLGGPVAATDYDQINASGTMDLSGAQVIVNSNAYIPQPGDSFMIVSHSGGATYTGFTALQQGQAYTHNGQVLHFTYLGGDGDDIGFVTYTPPSLDTTAPQILNPTPAGDIRYVPATTGPGTPLLSAPLFEGSGPGGGLPPVSSIFQDRMPHTPSLIAQVFGNHGSSLGGQSGGGGFLGFGGGDGGVFGSSTFAGIFSRDQASLFTEPEDDLKKGLRGVFGAPTLGQQLNDLQQREQQHVQALATALRQIEIGGAQA